MDKQTDILSPNIERSKAQKQVIDGILDIIKFIEEWHNREVMMESATVDNKSIKA